jgi:LysR family transcriptional regulator, mexEF-oprN operon transcriptional activator
MDIKEDDLHRIDLNLLVAFLVLMRERSVSRAAEHLFLGQPAVSGILGRLRELFDDPLLVRGRVGMQPTARALQLEARLKPALLAIHSALFDDTRFEPATSNLTFVVGMPDWVEIWLAPVLFASLRRIAPSVRLSIVNTDPFRIASMLEHGEMDLAVSQLHELPSWCRQQNLRTMPFRCVYSAGSERVPKRLTLDAYLERTHLLVSYRNTFESAADAWLAARGHKRDVALATTRFGTLPPLLRDVSMITTVPDALAEGWSREFGFAVRECPVPLEEVTVSSAWLAVRDREAPLRWFVKVLHDVAEF